MTPDSVEQFIYKVGEGLLITARQHTVSSIFYKTGFLGIMCQQRGYKAKQSQTTQLQPGQLKTWDSNLRYSGSFNIQQQVHYFPIPSLRLWDSESLSGADPVSHVSPVFLGTTCPSGPNRKQPRQPRSPSQLWGSASASVRRTKTTSLHRSLGLRRCLRLSVPPPAL